MSVRAKMKVDSIEFINAEGGGGGSVKLSPVISGSEENKHYYKYTPSGSLTLSTISAGAISQFELGQEFYIDITAASACSTKNTADSSNV